MNDELKEKICHTLGYCKYECTGENCEPVGSDKATENAEIADLMNLFEQYAAKIEKAYGGCKRCYGKGYWTVRKGNTSRGKTYDLRTHIYYCSCDRGRQLAELNRPIEPKQSKEERSA